MERKKIIYLSTVEDGPFQGVRKKIKMQCTAFEEIGNEVIAINSGKRTFVGQIEKLLPHALGINYRIIKKRIEELPKDTVQYCYIRYSPASRGLLDVMKTVKSNQKSIKMILEIPTYPYEDELSGVKAFPSKIKERIYRNKMRKYVDLVVTPSHIDQSTIFGIPALEITNGIDVDSMKIRTPVEKKENSINLIGVALITPKQGYDRVIKGISEYVKTKNPSEPDVFFYIIGTGNAKSELEKMSTELHLSRNIVFTGEKENEELEYFYSIADLGVGTLGLYKTNELSKVSSLKTREYCAKGLPFIITDCDYMFAENNFEFCKIVENNDSYIDIRTIIHFLGEIKHNHQPEEVISRMNQFANTHLSWSNILQKVIKTVDEIC